jgi:hypothetical protein
MDQLSTVFDGSLPYFILACFVLLHDPSNRRAVRLLRAWKAPRKK